MADVKVTLEIKKDEVQAELDGLKDAMNTEIKDVRAKYKTRRKELFAAKAKINRMMKTAEGL